MISESQDISLFSIEYCPHCGSKSFCKNTVKSFLCGECGFTYFQNAVSAGAVIIEYDKKILVTIRNREPAKGMLDLPGGFIDFGETAEEGIIREVKEELNLEINNVTYLASFPNKYYYKKVLYHTLDMIFLAKAKNIENIRIDDEIESYLLMKKEEIDFSKIAFNSVKKGLEMYLKFS